MGVSRYINGEESMEEDKKEPWVNQGRNYCDPAGRGLGKKERIGSELAGSCQKFGEIK